MSLCHAFWLTLFIYQQILTALTYAIYQLTTKICTDDVHISVLSIASDHLQTNLMTAPWSWTTTCGGFWPSKLIWMRYGNIILTAASFRTVVFIAPVTPLTWGKSPCVWLTLRTSARRMKFITTLLDSLARFPEEYLFPRKSSVLLRSPWWCETVHDNNDAGLIGCVYF